MWSKSSVKQQTKVKRASVLILSESGLYPRQPVGVLHELLSCDGKTIAFNADEGPLPI